MSQRFENFKDFEIFNNENLGSVRTLTDEERNIWFFANDVAACLGYEKTNTPHAISDHTDLEDRKALKYKASSESYRAEFFGKNDFMDKIFINEAGLYQMIFESHMPKAKEFKSWITHEVLPSVREHGGYILGQEKLAEEERNALNDKIVALMKKVKYLNTRRHELIQDNKALKEKSKKQAITIQKITEEADTSLELIGHLIDEGKEMHKKIDVLEEKIDRTENPEKWESVKMKEEYERKARYDHGDEITVDKEGLVISIKKSKTWDPATHDTTPVEDDDILEDEDF